MAIDMLSKLKQFNGVKHKLTYFSKCYCSDKFTKFPEISLQKEEKTRVAQESPNIIAQRYEECAEIEDKILKQVLVEKEKEATLQSRLSKECKTLFATYPASKFGAGRCPVLHLNQIPLSNPPDAQEWGTYPFDHLQSANVTEKLFSESTIDPKNLAFNSSTIEVTLKSSLSAATLSEIGGAGAVSGGGNAALTRPIRREPGKVLFCFIPEEWWRIFIPKTGVTGLGTFMFSFSTFLVSKEIYVLEHYYYHGLGALCTWILALKYVGPVVAKMLDKDIDKFEKAWNAGRVHEKQSLEDSIVHELYLQYQMEGQITLIEAKKENVQLQLEEEYRKRLMVAYNEVKQRLDYHIALELLKQRIQQKNLVDYVTREVRKAITPDMESKLIYYSIDSIVHDLNEMKK